MDCRHAARRGSRAHRLRVEWHLLESGPEVAISDSDGSLAVGEGSKLPDSWPTDLPAPDGIRLQSVVDSGSRTVALYLGPGDAKKLGQQLKSDLADNGYEQQATTTAGAETVTKYPEGFDRS